MMTVLDDLGTSISQRSSIEVRNAVSYHPGTYSMFAVLKEAMIEATMLEFIAFC
jgi:hypothetical protein